MKSGSSSDIPKTDAPKLTGLKKRQQIQSASKTMFLWIVVAAIAVSFSFVSMQYLFGKWQFNNKVIGAKYKAVSTLGENIENAQELKKAIDGLVANRNLASVKTNDEDANTKSVLDALPTTLEPAALATSLQENILSGSGVTIENITVPNESEIEAAAAAQEAVPQEVKFSFTVTGTYEKIKDALLDIERTIRPIKIDSIRLEGTNNNLKATVRATTYFQPVRSELVKQETIR